MRKFKCCLRGAYGPGNFGDDLLLISSLSVLEKIYDKKDIAITVHDVEKGKKFLPGYSLIPFSSPVEADIVLLGGGGQYFSFSSTSKKNKTKLEKISSLLNSGMTAKDFIYGYYLRKKFNRRWLSKYDVGFCLGLGPFEDETDRLYTLAKEELPKFSYLSVRDDDSFQTASSLSVKNLKKFTDPIFNSKLWMKSEQIVCKNSNDVAIIIRDWPFDKEKTEYIKKLENLSSIFIERGYTPKFVSLYADYDKEVISYYQSRGHDVVYWDPINSSLEDFLSFLKSCNCIITTRAHGAIVPSVLGVPTIIVNIEHKLKKIHGMLSNSSYLMELDSISDVALWNDKITSYFENKDGLMSGLSKDLKTNAQISSEATENILSYLNSVKL